ncbi:DUF3489 domain-containing protein [Rhodoblastus sp.]|uniref:DUF3489 domain-containing protein n=1 Tax=Rhodoblastus sp. TaxID=1962975 RepID=UPI003F9B7C61
MAKLTDTQLIVLSAAAARDDGIAIAPAKMNKAAASKVGSSLVARKLMREARSRSGMPIWRVDKDDRPISLVITRAGRNAIGVDEDPATHAPPPNDKPMEIQDASTAKKQPVDRSHDERAGQNAAPRAGTKQAQLIEMLSARKGATLDALVEATGWLPHTTRAALTGLRKRGFSIERTRDEGSASVYRIVAAPAAGAA